MMIRDTRTAHNQVLTCLTFEQAFLQIPKEQEDPIKYMSMLIPNVHKLSMILYVPAIFFLDPSRMVASSNVFVFFVMFEF
jgi:hypothetical protein